jgi:hypothetical protein
LIYESKRRQEECQTSIEKLENDRRLLAEAWERLERERIDGASTGGSHALTHSHSHAHAHAPQRPAVVVQQAAAPAFRPAVAVEANDVVAHAILKQFQALRSDVRKTAHGRRPQR